MELTKLIIRPFEQADLAPVIAIWEQCGLIKSWNNPSLDIQRKISFQNPLFFVGATDAEVIATAMFGYEGHRGWLNYLAVSPPYQKRGIARQLLAHGEAKLMEHGCPKLNLQIRADNLEVINFYKKTGFNEDAVISFGKRLIKD